MTSRSAVRYDATIREWLALYKYRGHEALEPLLGEMLTMAYRSFRAEHDNAGHVSWRPDAVIPVPVSDDRLLERGFNQAERLASCLVQSERLSLHDILRRTRHSDKQSFKTRGARLRDTQNLFEVDEAAMASMLLALQERQPKRAVSGRCRLLLVDDIYTTGSTLNACAQAIANAMKRAAPGDHLEIYCITLARS